jgi:hypothetical protein
MKVYHSVQKWTQCDVDPAENWPIARTKGTIISPIVSLDVHLPWHQFPAYGSYKQQSIENAWRREEGITCKLYEYAHKSKAWQSYVNLKVNNKHTEGPNRENGKRKSNASHREWFCQCHTYFHTLVIEDLVAQSASLHTLLLSTTDKVEHNLLDWVKQQITN